MIFKESTCNLPPTRASRRHFVWKNQFVSLPLVISIVVSLICILKLVVLVKFSLSHAKIEKILEKVFVMINKDEGGGGTSFRMLWGGESPWGILPVPTRENPEEPCCLAVSKQESSYSTNDRLGCYQKNALLKWIWISNLEICSITCKSYTEGFNLHKSKKIWMHEHCLKRPWMRLTVKPFKYWWVLNIGNIQFLKQNLRLCTLWKHIIWRKPGCWKRNPCEKFRFRSLLPWNSNMVINIYFPWYLQLFPMASETYTDLIILIFFSTPAGKNFLAAKSLWEARQYLVEHYFVVWTI